MGSRLYQLESSLRQYKTAHSRQRGRRSSQQSMGHPIRPRSFSRIDYTVPGTLAVVPQPTNRTCWAAAYTALINWRDQESRGIEQVLADVGPRWVTMFRNNQGLPPGQHDAFAADAGLSAISNLNLTLQAWHTLLREHGPVFVVVDMRPGGPGGYHARVVCGIHEGATPQDTELDIIDPGRGGQRYRERLPVFLARYEAEVAEQGRARTQIMYLPQGASRTFSRERSRSAKSRQRRVTSFNRPAPPLRPVYMFTAVDYTVPGPVQGISQPSVNGAWAALVATMMGWKENRSMAVTEALNQAGNDWQGYLNRNEIPPDDRLTELLARTGLTAEPPGVAAADALEQKLRDFGPLIVARAGQWQTSGQIITAMQGDGTPQGTRLTLIDPMDGGTYQLPLADYIAKLSGQNGTQGGIQLIHWPRGARRNTSAQQPPAAATQSFAPSLSFARPQRFPGVLAMNQSFDIRYDVQLVPQSHQMSCWAAGFSMILGWQQQMSIDPREIAAGIGYWRQYYLPANEGGGLPPDDTRAMAHWGFVAEPPQTYTVDGFRRLLEDYGPLWTAAATPGAHIRVVTGIHGDGSADGTFLHINDPGPVNQGGQYTETYRQYVARQSELGAREINIPGAIYVAHLPALPEWMRETRARSLSFTLMPTQLALTTITHAGPYRLAYDRLSTYGVIEPLPGRNTRNFRGDPSLQTALNNWAALLPRVMNPAPAYILTGGLYVDKPGAHSQGIAIDVDGFWWSDTEKFMALDAPTDWWRYLRIEATLRKYFGTVLNYDYNRDHQNHWHCDLGGDTNWRGVTSQAKFVQRALNEIWGESLSIDGQFGDLSRTALTRAGYDFSQQSGWQHFLDNIIAQQSTQA